MAGFCRLCGHVWCGGMGMGGREWKGTEMRLKQCWRALEGDCADGWMRNERGGMSG